MNPMTYAEYEQTAEEFQDRLRDGDFPDQSADWFGVIVVVVCRTTGCSAENIAGPGQRLVVGVGGLRAQCAYCRQPPTLIAEFTDGIRELPNVHPAPEPQPGPGDTGEEGEEGQEGVEGVEGVSEGGSS
ncbi:hypothetical protein ACFVWN_01120 [Nocardiopsis flavescens]|uniref:hypothetical protein n=1 Tax=Nocardiopsis flavescens TaxID=758803 RepID=UPI00365DE5E0